MQHLGLEDAALRLLPDKPSQTGIRLKVKSKSLELIWLLYSNGQYLLRVPRNVPTTRLKDDQRALATLGF